MNNILYFCLASMAFLVLPLVFYPLQQTKKFFFILALSILLLLYGGYRYWGGSQEWGQFLAEKRQQERAQAILSSLKNPQQIVENLKRRLQREPNSIRGWYLLGRLYASQGKWQKANSAFKKAYTLDPQDELIAVNYIQSIWQLNNQQGNELIRSLLAQVLHKNPAQVDALAMISLDAFKEGNYQRAIYYWRALLKLLPLESKEAYMIRKAIAKAQRMLAKA